MYDSYDKQNKPESSTSRYLWLSVAAVFTLALGLSSFKLVENVDATEIVVIQSLSGNLSVYTEPGPVLQLFGKITRYPRQAQYAFSAPPSIAKQVTDTKGQVVTVQVPDPAYPDTSKKLRFNDGGHGKLSGSVQWEMPLDPQAIIKIHKAFNSEKGVEERAVAKMLDSSIYLAGPLMSSTESSGSRRSELVQYINDQAENGVYVTRTKEIRTHDPSKTIKLEADGKTPKLDNDSDNDRTALITEIVISDSGVPKRQQGSVLKEFGIKLLPLSITDLDYDSVVENQIKQRQEATTKVQIAQANARRAEQDAITIAAQGEANAAEAKWTQETIKAKEVTLAQQKLDVARLAAQEAEQYKRQQILIGEGDAERKRLTMEADGALAQKLEAWKTANANYATAIAQAQPGAWTPVVQMGDSGNKGGADALIELLKAKTAKELALDLSVKK